VDGNSLHAARPVSSAMAGRKLIVATKMPED